MIARNHEAAGFRKTGMQCEVRRHVVMEGSETELPSALGDTMHNLATGSDDDFESRERIALAELLEQRNPDARVGGRRQCQRKGRQRAGLDLADVRKRLALLVQRRLRKPQQPNTRLSRLRRIAS